MGLSRRQFTKEFKLAAVRRLEQGVSIAEAARALEVNPNVLHRWRREFRQGPGNAFPGNGTARWSEGRIAELERKVGQQALEIDFLKGCLQPREREIMRRFYVEEQSPTDICLQMKLTATQFRLLKSRAKARFAEFGQSLLRPRQAQAAAAGWGSVQDRCA
jgi:transposase-like protein